MDVRAILTDSLKLLVAKPKVFIPRIITTFLYSVFTLYSMGLTIDMLDNPQQSLTAPYMGRVAVLFAAMPLLYFIDVLSYAMYPKIVADHQAGREIDLGSALKDGLRVWKVVLALVIILIGFLVFVVITTVTSYVLYLLSGSHIAIIASFILIVALVLFFSIVMFFVVPVAVLEGRGVRASFRESFNIGLKNKVGLFRLNIVFLLLVVITLAMSYLEEANTLTSATLIILFILIRLAGAVVYTYLSVTNPMAYLRVRINKSPEK
jgi:hypothetical protein